jgi:hypothetical protein
MRRGAVKERKPRMRKNHKTGRTTYDGEFGLYIFLCMISILGSS